MNWIQALNQTYENNRAFIGDESEEGKRPLLPICHITTQAHIEVVITGQGNFRRARVIQNKTEATTIIPSTEGSASRSGSKPENHPLCDKLQYVAGDFTQYGGIVTSGFAKKPNEPFDNFVMTLSKWCDSPHLHPRAEAVLNYVLQKRLIQDLVNEKILLIGDDQKFKSKDEVPRDKTTRDIFSVVEPQYDAFIRWVVEIDGEPESRVWRDASLWQSWAAYYLESRQNSGFCYVAGKNAAITTIHPKYIRREGDGAKLISSNDTNGFTFRGRFLNGEQACTIGLETSQQAHYALQWLISRQGYKKGDLAIVAWAVSGAQVPQPMDGPLELLFGSSPIEKDTHADTAQEVGVQFRNRIAGYEKAIEKTDHIVVMAVDSATPGRLAITYFRDLSGSSYLERIENWHKTCAWEHRYGEIIDRITNKKKYIPFIGAPSPSDIAEAAYGSRVDEKLRKATISRLLPCIVDSVPVPRDLVECTIRRASNRAGLTDWDWMKALSIACSLYKKYRQGKESFEMPLDKNRTTRDYLYGRLLAIADVLEERALSKGEQKRATNAARYMQQFSQNPFRTWKQVHDALAPYILRLGGAYYYKNLISDVESLFTPEDFISNKPLSGEYLLGFYCQRKDLKTWKEIATPEENVDSEENI